MKKQVTDSGYVIRLEKGEKFVDTLVSFCEDEGVVGAVFTGIGSAESVELGFYNPPSKSFSFKIFDEALEVIGMNGNISIVDEKPFIHAHGTFSDNKFQTIGGHIKDFVVGPTVEIFLTNLNTEIGRKMDKEIGLKLLDI